jgi:ATP-dependent DNA helicase DinG
VSKSLDPEKSDEIESLAIIRALGGTSTPLDFLQAHVDSTQGEHRPQQEEMVKAVTDSLISKYPLLVQAGTGTGKSLAYLFPLAVIGGRSVIATATNQLSEQLLRHDLPQVEKTMEGAGLELSFALLKGRNNYVCLARTSELETLERQASSMGYPESTQDLLFDIEPLVENETKKKKAQAKYDAADIQDLMEWVKHTETGDRTEGKVVPDRVWSQVSVSSSDCPGAGACPFGSVCFTELARKKAKAANIVVTNHALLAQDLIAGDVAMDSNAGAGVGASVFGPHKNIVVDEAHAFASTLTSALSRELDPRSISKFLSRAAKYIDDNATDANKEPATIASARSDLEALTTALNSLPPGPILELPSHIDGLIISLAKRLLFIHTLLSEAAKSATQTEKTKRAIAIQIVLSQAESLADSVSSSRKVGGEQVRWVDRDRRDNTPIMYIAPIVVGDFLRNALNDRTFIGTSATLTLGGDFSPIAHTLGLDKKERMAKTIDVGSPFDYPKQGMLYIPSAPFPEPVGKDRVEHTAAVLDTLSQLVHAAGGRTLALFTTTAGAIAAATHLRSEFPGLTVHAHGDAPADSLVRQFAEEETSVLCVTMGLWQGISVEGPSCSLVVIDKVAFAPIDDVLTAARRAYVDKQGRDGFTEIIVGQAATSLAQGAGRLIRAAADRGVVAILDPRLLTKGYGRLLLKSLPDFKRFNDLNTVTSALIRLTGGLDEQAFTPVPKTTSKKGNAHTKAKTTVRRKGATKALGTKSLRPRKID